jgi:hypothetical protein
MSRTKVGADGIAWLRKPATLLSLSLLLLIAQLGGHAQAPGPPEGPLSFFKNYFITGDYAVGGKSLWRKGVQGRATADISISGVPGNADILAVFLYVQTAERVQWSGIDHATYRGPGLSGAGNDLGAGNNSLAKALNWDLATPPCWSVAWPGGRRLVTYRADVLKFLPINSQTGKHRVNGQHRVVVPDSGIVFGDDDEGGFETGNGMGPRAIGTSLVVVYRDSTKPYKAIVIYDGGYTKRAPEQMSQTIEGFYQASGTPNAKLTHIVGDGRWFLSERLHLNGQLVATNPFVSADGPKWDNRTISISNKLPGLAGWGTVTLRVEPHLLPDCLSWSAIIFSTTVQDTDSDGLLDVWETHGGLTDPNGEPLPNLTPFASKYHKDLFIEIGYLATDRTVTYGSGDLAKSKPKHTHLPAPEVLRMVGEAFQNAPVSNPDRTNGINVHFDVGQDYPRGEADPFVIRNDLARGGESLDELNTVCNRGPSDPPWVCQFSAYPGTVGWKSGFRFFRDMPLSLTDEECDAAEGDGDPLTTCERVFDRDRKHMFRYALFAHALGVPKEACLEDGFPVVDCQETNPLYHVPVTNTGVGDFPGGDVMVTLGAFDDSDGKPIGTPFMQASTLMHEFGHTFERRHGGDFGEPNCKPNYLSVMNYLFQLRGLINADDDLVVDFSGQRLGVLNESRLFESTGLGGQQLYRTAWYVPQKAATIGSAATLHCDGTELLRADDGTLVEPPTVRVDGPPVGEPIDWNADGDTFDVVHDQDVNFNGVLNESSARLRGSNDWASVRLNQLGSRRNVGGWFLEPDTADPGDFVGYMGPLSLDVGRGDLGRGDLGRGDLGRGDLGRGDLGRGDLGRGDLGRGDLGRGGLGRGDLGRGDLGRGDLGRGDLGQGDSSVGAPGEPFGEVTLEIAVAAGLFGPPTDLMACVAGVGDCSASGEGLRVRLDWQSPDNGSPTAYNIYRLVGDMTPESVAPLVGTVTPFEGALATTFVDSTVDNGTTYTYFVTAEFDNESESGPSNTATVTTPPGPTEGLNPPILLSPVNNAVIQQNDPASGCSLLPGSGASRGRGFSIVFNWSDVESPGGIMGYRIYASRVGSVPILNNVFVESSEFTYVACNAFVADSLLTNWEWRVQTVGAQEQMSPFSPLAQFQFEPCLLDDNETSCSAPAPPSASGSVVDPSGDALQEGPDLVAGTVLVEDDNITLNVRFAPETFNQQTAIVQFLLDTDQNVATGHQGTDAGCSAPDNSKIGAEYIVVFGAVAAPTQALVVPFTGPTCNQFGAGTLTGAGSVIYLANGMDVTFPRSLIGNDNGLLNFKVISYTSGSSVLDRMTDAGAPASVVTPQG